jgi:hypothetical protein
MLDAFLLLLQTMTSVLFLLQINWGFCCISCSFYYMGLFKMLQIVTHFLNIFMQPNGNLVHMFYFFAT